MKKIILLFTFAAICQRLLLATDNNQIFIIANEYYKKGQYDSAIVLYKQILNSGYHSAEVYYNIGNAYFKKKNIPNAILYYERAHKLKPNDDEINFNLQLAQSMTVDKITPLPEFFLKRWWRAVTNLMSSDKWAILASISFITMLIFILLYLFSPWMSMRKLSFFIAIFLFISTLISISNSYSLKKNIENHKTAIIISPSVTIKSSPDENGTELFVLHEGTKVFIMDQIGDWLRIKIADGNNGWIKKEDLELI